MRHHQATHAGIVSDDDDGNHYHDDDAVASVPKKSPTVYDDSEGHYNGSRGSLIADRYKIIREVGVGTFGRVLECVDLELRRRHKDYQDTVA